MKLLSLSEFTKSMASTSAWVAPDPVALRGVVNDEVSVTNGSGAIPCPCRGCTNSGPYKDMSDLATHFRTKHSGMTATQINSVLSIPVHRRFINCTKCGQLLFGRKGLNMHRSSKSHGGRCRSITDAQVNAMIEDQLGSQQSQPPRQPSPRTSTNLSSRLPGTDRPASQSNRGPGRASDAPAANAPNASDTGSNTRSATSRVRARGQNGVDRPSAGYEELLAERTSLI